MIAFAAPTLRPLNMGQLLDRGIRLYRQNFLTFVGIVAIPQFPVSLLTVVISLFNLENLNAATTTPGSQALSTVSQFFGVQMLLGVTSVLLTQIATAAMTRAVADNYLGQSISILGTYRRVGKAWLSLVGALILMGLVGVGVSVWWLVPCIGWFTGLGMILFLTLVILPLVAPVVVLEKRRASQALSRTWDLARRRFWWLLGFTLLLYIFSYLIVIGPSFLVAFLLQGVTGAQFGDITTTVIQQIVTFIFNLIYLPLQLTCITLMYFDLRVRTEGLDLALQIGSETEQGKEDILAQSAQEVGFTSSILPNSTELGNFAIITVAGGILYFGLVFLLLLIGFSAGLAGL